VARVVACGVARVVACGIGGIHGVRAEERRKRIYDGGFWE
jgi:hypothetical protein